MPKHSIPWRRKSNRFLPNKHIISHNFQIRKQEKNMCVANAITAMNEIKCGCKLKVDDLYTKNMNQAGERLFVIVDKMKNKGQRIMSESTTTSSSTSSNKDIRLQFNAKPLNKPYVNTIKKALARNKSVVVTIKTYNHENILQRYRDVNGKKIKMKQRPHAICIYGYNDNVEDKNIHPMEKGYFYFINSHGKEWIQDGFGFLTYEYAEKCIEEGVVSM